jgi:hypothetical protein
VPRTAEERRQAAHAWDAAYRDKVKQRKIEESGDEYDGDPIMAITGLILLLPSSRSRGWAREAIATEVDRFLEPLYSANRSTIEQERFQRTQEAYSRHYGEGLRRTKHFDL